MMTADSEVHIVALVNQWSGERSAASFVMAQLKRHFGDDAVFDLFPNKKPAIPEAKEFLRRRAPSRAIVAGGDGTVSLVLDILDELRSTGALPSTSGHVVVLPMGTGNDLSRTLGFGGGYTKPWVRPEGRFDKIVKRAREAEKVTMDRWKLEARGVSSLDGASDPGGDEPDEPSLQRSMMNYFSVGFDAKIATQFDQFRSDHPTLCSKRLSNKLWFGCFGAESMCTAAPLPKTNVKLTVDGKRVALPEDAKALVVTNVLTYAGGTILWEDSRGRFDPPHLSDGKLEVSVLHGVWHMVGVRGGVRKARKVAQGSDVRIVVPNSFAMQYDGEAIHQETLKSAFTEIHLSPLSTTLVTINEERAVKPSISKSNWSRSSNEN